MVHQSLLLSYLLQLLFRQLRQVVVQLSWWQGRRALGLHLVVSVERCKGSVFLLGVQKVLVEPMLSVDVHCVASSCLLSLSLLDNRPLVTLGFEGSLFALAHLQLLVGWWRAWGVDARVHEITCLPWRKMMGWLHVAYLPSFNKALLRNLVMLGRILRSSVPFGRSWSLHLASLLRMDSLALLSDCSSVRTSVGLTYCSNR